MDRGSPPLGGKLEVHGIGNGPHRTAHGIGQASEVHVAVEGQERGEGRGEQTAVVRVVHGVAEVYPSGREVAHPAADPHPVVVAGGQEVAQGDLADRRAETGLLQVAVTHPGQANVLGAGDVEPDQVAGVVHHTHLIGLGVVHPHERLRYVGGDRGRLHG